MSINVKTRTAIVVAAATVAAAATGVAVASSPPLTITTPRAGSFVSRERSSYIAVAGGVQFAPSTPQTTRFFLRRAACGTTNDSPHLSVVEGTDAGDGCGLVVDSVVGLGGNADQAAFIDFPATDGMPLALDTGRQITGVIDLKGTAAGVAVGPEPAPRRSRRSARQQEEVSAERLPYQTDPLSRRPKA